MTEVRLGEFVEGDPGRDAIHIAVIPITAAEQLNPGDHVSLLPEGTAMRRFRSHAIGIVDPFLLRKVEKGERFWLLLYQKTVTGMRHAWSHPAFSDEVVVGAKPSSPDEAWIMNYAADLGLSYKELMDAAKAYIESGEMLAQGSLLEGKYTNDEFWEKYASITGKQGDGNFFRCSC